MCPDGGVASRRNEARSGASRPVPGARRGGPHGATCAAEPGVDVVEERHDAGLRPTEIDHGFEGRVEIAGDPKGPTALTEVEQGPGHDLEWLGGMPAPGDQGLCDIGGVDGILTAQLSDHLRQPLCPYALLRHAHQTNAPRSRSSVYWQAGCD